MSDLIERLGKLQDSCNKQELGLLDTAYVFELAGRAADRIAKLETALRKITSDELYNEAQMAVIADEALREVSDDE